MENYEHIYLIIIIFILMLIHLDNEYSYFGTGPGIFQEENIYGYYKPEYSLEPIYVKL